jgi:hypothetical protein
MKGRGDVARYQNGADPIENGIPVVHGGVVRRSGLRYLATTKDGGARKARLIRYVYSVDVSFVLEFGHLYFRAFDGATGSVVLNSGLTTLEVVSPYTEAQLAGITTKQIADIMYLFHPNQPTYQLRRITATLWTLLPVAWIVEPFAELGVLPDAKLALSAITVGAGRTFTTANVVAPGAPTGLVATPLNASARVAFTPPASNGGGVITSYTVTSSPGGFTATGASSPLTVTGLTNGVAYTFTAKATNAAGDSVASSASSSVTPLVSLGGGTITCSVTPTPFSTTKINGIRSVSGPTASGTSGTAPYTYAWTKLSGDDGIEITTANAAQVVLLSENYSDTNYAALRCTVTDVNGNSGTVDVSVYVEHVTAGDGGDGGGGGGYIP